MKYPKTKTVHFDKKLNNLNSDQLLQFYKDLHNRIYKVNTNKIG